MNTYQASTLFLCRLSLLVYFFILLIPQHSFGLTIDDLGTGFQTQKTAPAKNIPLNLPQLDTDLASGDIKRLMQKLNSLSPEGANHPDVYALKAIGYAAQNMREFAEKALSTAEKKNADDRYILYAQAMLSRLNNNHKKAVTIIEKAIKLEKAHPYPWNILGRIQVDQKDFKGAVESFKHVISLNSNFLPAYLNLGATHFQLLQYPQALEQFKKASAIDPSDDRTYLGQALAYEKLNQYENAAQALKKYIGLTGPQIGSLEHLAEIQNNAEDYSGLIDTGKIALKTDEDKGLLWQARGLIYLDQLKAAIDTLDKIKNNPASKDYLIGLYLILKKDYNSASEHISASLKKNPNFLAAKLADSTLWVFLSDDSERNVLQEEIAPKELRFVSYFNGLSAIRNGLINDALIALNKSDGLIPGFSMSGISSQSLGSSISRDNISDISLGTFFYLIRLHDRSQEVFESVVKKNDLSLLGNYWLGQIALEQGNNILATKYFHKSITNVDFFTSLYVLAELSYGKGETSQAQKYYSRALNLKSDVGILIKLGLIYEQSDNKLEAEKIYSQLIEDYGNLYIGYNQLAWFYVKNDFNIDKALSLAEKAEQLQPNNSSILDTIGWIHYKKNNYKKAEEYASRANKIVRNNPTILFHLGAIHKKLGQNKYAHKYLTQALAISSRFEEAGLAVELLEELR